MQKTKAQKAKQVAKKAAKAAGKAALNAAKDELKNVVRQELNKLPPQIRGKAAKVGNSLSHLASKISGKGDYQIHSNSLVKGGGVGIAPVFGDSRSGVRVRQREFVGTVVSGGSLSGNSTLFNNDVYRINPSNPRLFPWLSQMAGLFDQWEPHGLAFEFVSTSSTFNGSSQALGVVITATDYDTTDPPYANRRQMENSAFNISAKASENILHAVECDPTLRGARLLYTGGAQTPGRAGFCDLGNFQVATQGMSETNVTVGELHVVYDISFHKMQLENEGALLTLETHTPYNLADAPAKWFSKTTVRQQHGPLAGATWDGTYLQWDNPDLVGSYLRFTSHLWARNPDTATTGISFPDIDATLSTGAVSNDTSSFSNASFSIGIGDSQTGFANTVFVTDSKVKIAFVPYDSASIANANSLFMSLGIFLLPEDWDPLDG